VPSKLVFYTIPVFSSKGSEFTKHFYPKWPFMSRIRQSAGNSSSLLTLIMYPGFTSYQEIGTNLLFLLVIIKYSTFLLFIKLQTFRCLSSKIIFLILISREFIIKAVVGNEISI
jgi:hypothetical protein